MLISDEYRKLNQEMHSVRNDFGANGHRFSQIVVDLCRQLETRDVLDYGCGKGTLRKSVPMVDVRNYDPCVEEFSADPDRADIVVCTDVLEHIEPDCLHDVLMHIGTLARVSVVLSIATRPAVKVLPDGRNAHLIQENIIWWINKVYEIMGFTLMQVTNMDDKEFLAIYKNPNYSPSKEKNIEI